VTGSVLLVEAGGQCVRRFRGGLDYAFILIQSLSPAMRMRSVLSDFRYRSVGS